MKHLLTAIILFAMVAFLAAVAGAQAPGGTLYEQEETAWDNQDPVDVDAAGHGPAGNDSDNWTNWKYQYGGGSWSGVYAGSNGWMEETASGDMILDVEADIEMYYTETVSNNKVYFHIGNLYSLTTAQRTAYVSGSYTSNNGMWIGISFDGTTKVEADFEKDGSGDFTGVILDGMQSDYDTWRAQDNQMDVEIKLSWDGGTTWNPPGAYGDGSHSTIHDTLWWLVDGGAAGTHNYSWRIRLLPDTDQPDGDYYLDPVLVSAPIL